MPLTTKRLLRGTEEDDCIGMTAERKYYKTGDVFIKRSLRRKEWLITMSGAFHVPRLGPERLLNEAAAMRYVSQHTDIPIPKLFCCFEDDEAIYLIQEHVKGVRMADLEEEQKVPVKEQLRDVITKLHGLRSRHVGPPGQPGGMVIPPYRAQHGLLRDDWAFPPADEDIYALCHYDLSQHNVLVDPQTLKIKAVIDWEYAGFWPEAFEFPFYERLGPSVAIGDERDDSQDIINFVLDSAQV